MNSMYEFQPEDAFRFASFVGGNPKSKGNELQFQLCPYCHGGKSRDKNTFSINLKNGQFVCQRSSCGTKGNMITLAKDFDFELTEQVSRYYNVRNFNGQFKKFKESHVEVREPAVQYLASRGISEAICRKYEITTHRDDDSRLVFPFKDENGELKLVKYRNLNFKKGETKGNKEWCESDCMPILFGMNHCDLERSRTLVITEGQMDSLSLSEAGIENAVSVPFGVNGFTWVPHCWDFVKKFDCIVVFGDYEKGHVTLVEDIAKKFNMPIRKIREKDYQGCKDANEILQKFGPEALRNAVEHAEALPMKMVIDLSEVQPIDVFAIPKLKTGIHMLDSMLYGGIPFGGVSLITGKPGEGKSTMASQILVNAMDQDYKCFVYSGELENRQFKAWMNFQVAGDSHIIEYQSNLYGKTQYKISATNMQLMDAWYRGKCYLYDNSDIDGDEKEGIVRIVEEAILHYGVQVILIDNLMTALDLEKVDASDKYDKQSLFVKKLARIALKYNVLILLVAHKRKNNFSQNTNDEVAGSADIVNLATVTLSYERDSKIGDRQRLLKLTKNRLFGNLQTEGWILDFSEKSKRVYGPHDILEKEFGWIRMADAHVKTETPDNYDIPY